MSLRFSMALIVFVLGAGSSRARSPHATAATAPHYDPAHEITISGTVVHVLRHTPERWREIHVVVATSEGKEVEVHIAPAYYLRWKQFNFEKGQKVELVVSRATNEPHYLGRTVIEGNRVLVWRNASGEPLWKDDGSR